jgi:NitT/TauT family transport system substrate-binding protein
MGFRHARRAAAFGSVVAVLGGVLAGCSGSAAGGLSTTSKGLTHVNVGVLPINDDAAVYVALEHGLFDAHGLDVTPVILNSGEQATSELLSGQLQFAFSNYVSTVLAASQGAQLRIVAAGSQALPNTNDLMVARDSPIRNVAQLRGKSIAVNALGNIGTMMTNATLRAAGVPADSVHYKVVPFPDMAAALTAHTVDAAWMAEPFVTESGEGTGAEELADTASGPMTNLPIAGYTTLRSYAQVNTTVVTEFTAAVVQAQAMSGNRSVVEQAIATYISGATPGLVAAVQLDEYPSTLNRDQLQRVADLMLSAGLLSRPFNISQLLSP